MRHVANGGIYFSEGASWEPQAESLDSILTPRQLEALSLCASQPDGDTFFLANELGVTGSTLRNLLSNSYFRLGVRTRAAAIARAHQLGIIPVEPEPDQVAGNPGRINIHPRSRGKSPRDRRTRSGTKEEEKEKIFS